MLSYKVLIISLCLAHVVYGSVVDNGQQDEADKAEENLSRVKRALPFLKGSGNGVSATPQIVLIDTHN